MLNLKKVLLASLMMSACLSLADAAAGKSVTVVGAQFGDESKGKITDLLAANADVVARYAGGNNAGHTIVINGVKHKLHLIPSGIFRDKVICVLGAGMVISPEALFAEIDELEKSGVKISPANLKIAANAPLVLPVHKEIELIGEKVNKIGTTKQGIGPAYEDKAGRRAIRAGDLVNLEKEENRKSLEDKVEKLLHFHNALRRGYGESEISKDDVMAYLTKYAERIAPFVTDVSAEMDQMQRDGKKFLLEGAMSGWLDISHGTYPYVTSSNTLATAAGYGLGVDLKNNKVLGVVKAYTTRVGNGPFPTILNDATGEKIRQIGQEFGATTGRKRDCGWLDLVSLKKAIAMNGISSLVLAKADVLDGFETVKVCVAYKIDGKTVDRMPYEPALWSKIEPVYKEFKGWNNTKGVKDMAKLDKNYVEFIKFVEKETGLPVDIISTGPDRDETIVRKNPLV